ncbi:MAG: FtsH protease activity modulator HflK [Alphaproteobacteria bacterium]|nr:MAG: FtsH protease activity modulator HflK [Alphaproteobacteria bacterium]
MTKKDDKKNPWGAPKQKKKSDRRENNDDGWQPTSRDDSGNVFRNDSRSYSGGDMDDVFRNVQEKFQGFSPMQHKSGILLLLLVAGCIWLMTGFYRVQPAEHAVVMTFGKWTRTQSHPGLGYHLPWPVETVSKVDVTFERRIEIGFRGGNAPVRASARSNSVSNGVSIQSESLMVTGDENIIDINFVVLWRVSDAAKYLFEIRNPEDTIKKVAESAMREVIGRTEIQRALAEARGEIESLTRELMQAMMDEYESGVMINEVKLQAVNPPEQVVEAFDDVLRARADKDRLRNEAEAYRNRIIPEARGESERILQQAEAYLQEVTDNATGEAERFLSVYKAYAAAKDVTSKRMYLETMQEIMGQSKKFIIGGENGGNVLPYLPLDALKEKR